MIFRVSVPLRICASSFVDWSGPYCRSTFKVTAFLLDMFFASWALPNKTRVLRKIAPESSLENSVQSLSHKFSGAPFFCFAHAPENFCVFLFRIYLGFFFLLMAGIFAFFVF